MKKIYIFVIMVLMTTNLMAAEGFGGSVQMSRMIDHFKDYSISATDIDVHYNFEYRGVEITPFTKVNTWMVSPDKGNYFQNNPFRDIYVLGIKSEFKGFGFAYDHYCSHSVDSGYISDDLNKTDNKYEDIFAHSQVTKYSLNYTYELKGFEVFANVSKTIETKSYLISGRLTYTYSIFSIYFDYAQWSGNVEDSRNVKTYGITAEYKGIYINIEKYDSSSVLEKLYNHNHLYNENPLTDNALYITAGYKFN